MSQSPAIALLGVNVRSRRRYRDSVRLECSVVEMQWRLGSGTGAKEVFSQEIKMQVFGIREDRKNIVILLGQFFSLKKPLGELCERGIAERLTVKARWIHTRDYCSNAGGSPLIRFHFRLTLTSTRFAILMNGMPLFMP